MKWLVIPASAIFALSLACAVDDDDTVPTVQGATPGDAAQVSAQTSCEYAARCGNLSISCADCAQGESCGGCFAEIFDVDFDACMGDVLPDFQTGFACPDDPVTADEEALVDECLQALVVRDCPTVEEAEAWASGQQSERPEPEACRTLEHIRFRCYDYTDTDTPGGTPIPDPD